jgi:hypothetical protein
MTSYIKRVGWSKKRKREKRSVKALQRLKKKRGVILRAKFQREIVKELGYLEISFR